MAQGAIRDNFDEISGVLPMSDSQATMGRADKMAHK